MIKSFKTFEISFRDPKTSFLNRNQAYLYHGRPCIKSDVNFCRIAWPFETPNSHFCFNRAKILENLAHRVFNHSWDLPPLKLLELAQPWERLELELCLLRQQEEVKFWPCFPSPQVWR